MKICEIIEPLTEGGQAIKGAAKVSQADVRKVTPDLLKHIQTILKLSKSKVKLIGSAGKKPEDSDLSGDIDVAVECETSEVEHALEKLANGKDHRAMRGIGVYSFAYPVGKKLVQVDVIPVQNVKYAEWSYQANPKDLAQGLKGAQRNELFFAIAKHIPQVVLSKGEDGEPIDVERHFYDLSKGLMVGTRSRKNKNGKVLKNFATTEKKVLSNDPAKVVELMFGDFTPDQVSTFDGTLKAIKSSKFVHRDLIDDILQTAADGIKNKSLKVPDSISI